MSDINLLPEDLRNEEEKAKRKIKLNKGQIKMTSPDEGPEIREPKTSFWGRLFVPKEEKRSPLEKNINSVVEKFSNELDLPKKASNFKFFRSKKKKESVDSEKPLVPKEKITQPINFSSGKKVLESDPISPQAEKNLEPEKQSVVPKENQTVQAEQQKAEVEPLENAFGVDLIPRELQHRNEQSLKKRISLITTSLLVSLLLVLGLYVGMLGYESYTEASIGKITKEIQNLDDKLKSLEERKQEALDLQQRLKAAKKIVDGHIYWTTFFSELEKYTVEDVYFNDFSMPGRDKLTIMATARDYETAAQQLIAFESAENFIKSVRMDTATANIDPATLQFQGVNFNIHLEFYPAVFQK